MSDIPPRGLASATSLGPLLLTGIFGLVGVALGGLLQYQFGGSLEVEKQRLQIQLSAYADFAKAQASLQRAELQEKDRSRKAAAVDDANLKIRDAAFRMVIFSPAEVVEALTAFTRDRHPGDCGSTTPQSDIDVYKKMRRQIRSDGIADDDIVMALFGCKRKSATTP